MSEIGRESPLAEGLRRFLEKPRRARSAEACDLCAQSVPPEHPHLVQIDTRRLLCACRLCSLLFEPEAVAARYRIVPDRCLDLGDEVMSEDLWDRLQVPVSLAFFFFNSSLGHIVAFYPGAAGARESALPLDTWTAIAAGCPALAGLAPDVEALLVRRLRGGSFESFLVPIDVCYELVGRIKRSRKDSGKARPGIGALFERLRERVMESSPSLTA